MRARHRHFNPAHAGMGLALDARFIFGLSSGADVGTWSDRSNNANNATEANNKPTFQTAIQGGQPVVRFVANNQDRLNCASSVFSGSNQRVLVAVYKSTATGTYVNAIGGQAELGSAGRWFVMQSRTQFATGDPYIAGFSADTTNNQSTPDNLWKVASGAFDGTNLITRKNGTQIDSVSRSFNTVNNVFRVGHTDREVPKTEFFNGDIACVLAGQITYSLPLVKKMEHALAFSFKISCN